MCVFECATWTRLSTMRIDTSTWGGICFLQDETFVSGALNGTVVTWDALTGTPRSAIAGDGAVHAMAAWGQTFACGALPFVACGQRGVGTDPLLARVRARVQGRESGRVDVFVVTGQLRMPLAGHTDAIADLLFAHDGAHLVSTSGDGTARVWNVATGACECMHDFGVGLVLSASLTAAGMLAVALYAANEVRVVRLLHSDVLKTVAVESPNKVWFAPMGDRRDLGYLLYFSGEEPPGFPLAKILV